MEDLDFIEICNNAKSMRSACLKLNMSFSSFKRRAIKLNCYNTDQNWRKNRNIISDNRIKSKHGKVSDIFSENSSARRDYIKKLIISNNIFDYKCSECDIENVWNNKIISLHLDHINGIRNDNRIDNLRFLCPNCHSQTETYCNKNKSQNLNINSINIDKIIDCINDSKSITQVINKLGLYDTKKNRNLIKLMVPSFNG